MIFEMSISRSASFYSDCPTLLLLILIRGTKEPNFAIYYINRLYILHCVGQSTQCSLKSIIRKIKTHDYNLSVSATFARVSMSTRGKVLRRKFWLHKSLWWNNSESHRNNPCVRISFDSNHIVIVVVTFCNQERHILDTYIMASRYIRAKMSEAYVKFLDLKLQGVSKKTEFCQIEHLQILLVIGEKYLMIFVANPVVSCFESVFQCFYWEFGGYWV